MTQASTTVTSEQVTNAIGDLLTALTTVVNDVGPAGDTLLDILRSLLTFGEFAGSIVECALE